MLTENSAKAEQNAIDRSFRLHYRRLTAQIKTQFLVTQHRYFTPFVVYAKVKQRIEI